jgi:uncharacterized membrane protein YjdF
MKLLTVVTDVIHSACHYIFSRLTDHTSGTVSMWLCSEVVEVKRVGNYYSGLYETVMP